MKDLYSEEGLIDIHSHMLPNLDDGAQTLEMALEMARQAVMDGIHTVIATPHHGTSYYDIDAETSVNMTEQLSRALAMENIPLQLKAGLEVRLTRKLPESLNRQLAATLSDTRYLLLELPSNGLPDYWEEVLHELTVMGMVPILAHPERYACFHKKPGMLRELNRMGVLMQVTAGALSGGFGRRIKSFSWKLCNERLVHFVASDAHHPQNRPPLLSPAYQLIDKKLGQEYSDYYKRNAEWLLADMNISPESPSLLKRRWIFGWGKRNQTIGG